MTARELARRINVPHSTVSQWLQKGQVPGAKAENVGDYKIWVVPIEAAHTFPQWRPKRGRPPLTDEEKAARAKKRTAGAQTSLFESAAAATKAKAGTKRTGVKKAAKRKGGAAK